MIDPEQQAIQEGWERTMELRLRVSWTPGERPRLQQKWTRFVHGYGEDIQEERWVNVPHSNED